MYFRPPCYGFASSCHFVYLAIQGARPLFMRKQNVFAFFVTALSEIHICSNNHETDLIVPHLYASYDHRIIIVWDPI